MCIHNCMHVTGHFCKVGNHVFIHCNVNTCTCLCWFHGWCQRQNLGLEKIVNMMLSCHIIIWCPQCTTEKQHSFVCSSTVNGPIRLLKQCQVSEYAKYTLGYLFFDYKVIPSQQVVILHLHCHWLDTLVLYHLLLVVTGKCLSLLKLFNYLSVLHNDSWKNLTATLKFCIFLPCRNLA